MPRVALRDSFNYAGYLGVSTLHTFKINKFMGSSSTDPAHRNYSYDVIDDFFIQHTFRKPTRYPRILAIDDLRSLWGRHTYTASLR
jgi:hypothetical protein